MAVKSIGKDEKLKNALGWVRLNSETSSSIAKKKNSQQHLANGNLRTTKQQLFVQFLCSPLLHYYSVNERRKKQGASNGDGKY